MPPRILFVEDEPSISDPFARALAAGRLRAGDGAHRARGACARGSARSGSRAARPEPARHRRPRRGSRAPPPRRHADRDADGPRHGDGPDRRDSSSEPTTTSSSPSAQTEVIARIRAVLRRARRPAEATPVEPVQVGAADRGLRRAPRLPRWVGAPAVTQGVRSARRARSQRRPGRLPRGADGARMGRELVRVDEDPRHARRLGCDASWATIRLRRATSTPSAGSASGSALRRRWGRKPSRQPAAGAGVRPAAGAHRLRRAARAVARATVRTRRFGFSPGDRPTWWPPPRRLCSCPLDACSSSALVDKASESVRGRVLIVDASGRVLADSAGAGQVGATYAGRPEIAAALRARALPAEPPQRHARRGSAGDRHAGAAPGAGGRRRADHAERGRRPSGSQALDRRARPDRRRRARARHGRRVAHRAAARAAPPSPRGDGRRDRTRGTSSAARPWRERASSGRWPARSTR